MSVCPGLHCPGCSEGQSAGILAAVIVVLVVADRIVPWVAERVWWIGGTTVACLALSVAASMWLEGRTARREAEFARRRGIYSRADFIAPYPAAGELPHRQRPGIAPPSPITINIFGMPDAQQAEVIRRAINGGTQ